jgi:hypothetical protein
MIAVSRHWQSMGLFDYRMQVDASNQRPSRRDAIKCLAEVARSRFVGWPYF